MRVMAQNDPFSEPPEEELLFSRDLGTIVRSIRDSPRNVFTFVRKSNRTRNSDMSVKDPESERDNQEAFNISVNTDPSFLLNIPNSKSTLSKYLASNLIMTREES